MIPMAENCFTVYHYHHFLPFFRGGKKKTVLFLAVSFGGDGVISFSECGQWDGAMGVTRQFLRNHFSV